MFSEISMIKNEKNRYLKAITFSKILSFNKITLDLEVHLKTEKKMAKIILFVFLTIILKCKYF